MQIDSDRFKLYNLRKGEQKVIDRALTIITIHEAILKMRSEAMRND